MHCRTSSGLSCIIALLRKILKLSSVELLYEQLDNTQPVVGSCFGMALQACFACVSIPQELLQVPVGQEVFLVHSEGPGDYLKIAVQEFLVSGCLEAVRRDKERS